MKKLMVLTMMMAILALARLALAQPFYDFNDEAEMFYEQFYDTLEYQLYNSVSANTGDASGVIQGNATNNALLTQANCGNAITGNVAYETKADASGGRGGTGISAATGGDGGAGGTATFDMGTSTNGQVNGTVSMAGALTGFTGVGGNGQVVGIMNNQLNTLAFGVGGPTAGIFPVNSTLINP
jgi:hypothetical protein